MRPESVLSCNSCDEKSAVLFWDRRYNGYRGRCMMCGGNWAES